MGRPLLPSACPSLAVFKTSISTPSSALSKLSQSARAPAPCTAHPVPSVSCSPMPALLVSMVSVGPARARGSPYFRRTHMPQTCSNEFISKHEVPLSPGKSLDHKSAHLLPGQRLFRSQGDASLHLFILSARNGSV